MQSHTYFNIASEDRLEISGEGAGRLDITTTRHGEALTYNRVVIEAGPKALAEILVELSTWPDVVAAAGERFREAILGHVPDDYVPPLSPIAVDYFRRAFDHYGLVLAEAKAEGGDDA